MVNHKEAILVLVLPIVLIPSTAFAYVDPGIIAALYQAVYVFIFGTLVVWLLRPWVYIKDLLNRLRRMSTKPGSAETPKSADDHSEST